MSDWTEWDDWAQYEAAAEAQGFLREMVTGRPPQDIVRLARCLANEWMATGRSPRQLAATLRQVRAMIANVRAQGS